MKNLIGLVYEFVFWLREKFEHFHLVILFADLGVLFVAISHVLNEFHHWADLTMHDVIEFALFFVLILMVISDVIVRFRKVVFGYAYSSQFIVWLTGARRQQSPSDTLIPRLAKLHRNDLAGWPICRIVSRDAIGIIVNALARESAAVFSERAFAIPDKGWASAEAEYLNKWLADFPDCIWWVGSAADAANLGEQVCSECPDGYYSIIVPIAEHSYAAIHKGHLNTALAHLDRSAAKFVNDRKDGEFEKPIKLLAYAQVQINKNRTHAFNDLSPLLYSSLMHLNYLLNTFRKNGEPYSNVKIICEVAGYAQTSTLESIGFAAVSEIREGKEVAMKSAAGFFLYEMEISSAQPGAKPAPILELLRAVREER